MTDTKVVWRPITPSSALPPYGERVLITRIWGMMESCRMIAIALRDHTDQNGEWWSVPGEGKVYLSATMLPEHSDSFRVLAWAPLPEAYR